MARPSSGRSFIQFHHYWNRPVWKSTSPRRPAPRQPCPSGSGLVRRRL